MMPQLTSPPWARTVLICSLVVGVLDGLDAVLFFFYRGVSPSRLFQYIASAVLGPSTASWGNGAIFLGIALHFTVAAVLGGVYLGFARLIPWLRTHWVLGGGAYGLGAYCFINGVVLPLTRAKGAGGWPPTPVLINGVLAHLLLVGLPIGFVVARAYRAQAKGI
ncbi:MAG: hypothetical protein JNN01_22080 [Opitutaceae bacterium]|nr:hypothetical protein [Opitutaceae bacterium]